jgi:hypothetical protein
MNLIQIQEHLKDLPTQAIMSYANGQNPQVPPYMALGEMNRRKSMEQRAAQAPDSSVKEKLESELSQQIALPGVGQGMNMRMNPAGMPRPMPAVQPQMAPQMRPMQVPPMAQKMPPQQMSQPGSIPAGAPGMAGGGLAELPISNRMFNYAPGGIVAFAGPDDQLVLPPGESVSGTYSEEQAPEKLPVDLANQILRKRLLGQVDLPQPVDRDKVIAEQIAKNPQLAGLLNKIPGEALGKLATQLEQQNAAQRSRFQEGEGRQGLAALSQALIAAGEATRGQKGIGAAFGGFGKSYNAATAAQEERAAKQQALERAQTIETMKLQADIENMQRAYAEGDIDKAMRFKEQANAREAKIAEMQGAGATEVLNQADKLAQRQAQEARYKSQEAHEKRMYDQTRQAANKPSRFQEELALLKENPDLFNKMQGQTKSGTLTFEDAMNILRKDKLNTGKSLEDLSQMAQRMVNAAKLVQSGQTIPEPIKPPEDTRSFLDKLRGVPAPQASTSVPKLPADFVIVPPTK